MNPGKISIAFYNLENFFDTDDDPLTDDNPFTPKGVMHWVKKRFQRKSKKIAYVISKIGVDKTGEPPILLGLAEIENKKVLNKIIKQKSLKAYDYNFVHFDSGDRRGMDVALLYRKRIIDVLDSHAYPLTLYDDSGNPYKTRDILYVKIQYMTDEWHLFINHWPSRREGDFESDFKRQKAAERLSELIDYVYYENPEAKFIIMGDFNTDPNDPHLVKIISERHFFNPATKLFIKQTGSLNHQGKWHLFDQIIFSSHFKETDNFHLINYKIFSPEYIKTWKGKYKNTPFRTYKGRKYQGGYSDHFPVYAVLKKEK